MSLHSFRTPICYTNPRSPRQSLFDKFESLFSRFESLFGKINSLFRLLELSPNLRKNRHGCCRFTLGLGIIFRRIPCNFPC